MESSIGKKVIVFVTLMLGLVLAAAVIHFNSLEKQKVQYLESLRSEAYPLEHQKWKLEQEIRNIEKHYTLQMQGIGTASVLVTELDEEVYTKLYPLMKEYGMTGVIAVSKDQFPGSGDGLTKVQFREMLEAGWTSCLVWDGEAELGIWLKQNKRFLESEGVEFTSALYFPYNTYSVQYDDILADNGVRMAVHHGEEGLKLVITETEENIWHPGACMWNTTGVQSVVENAIDSGGNIVLTVGFTETEELFHPAYFENMLIKLKKWEENGELLITDLDAARKCRTEAENGRSGYETELDVKRERLQAQIDDLTEEIQAIYNQFREKYGEEI